MIYDSYLLVNKCTKCFSDRIKPKKKVGNCS